jgi:zinc transport system substrate-binding protein
MAPLFAIVVLLTAACGEDPAPADRRLVVASVYPLAYAAERLGGDGVQVVNLTPPGVEPHDLELTADDLEAIASADAVLMLGGGFQPAVEDAVAAAATGAVIDVAKGVATLPSEDPDGELAFDPHVWLDPARFRAIVEHVAGALEEAGVPTQERATALLRSLDNLRARYDHGLAGCAGEMLVTNHAAFGYLAEAYGLEQEAISGLAPEAEPDPARLAELAETIAEQGVTTIFSEALLPADVAETLAAEAGIRVAILDPLEGLSPERLDAGEDYLSVMARNLEVVREGLGCPAAA